MLLIEYVNVILVCGFFATTMMTLFVLLVHKISANQLNVIRILGTMLTHTTTYDRSTSSRPVSVATGLVSHYAVGYFFTAFYVIAWQHKWLGYTTVDCALIGFITGLFGILVWRIYFAIHRFAPAVRLSVYLPTILIAHVVFGVSAGWLYRAYDLIF
jgi:hypothetical protein